MRLDELQYDLPAELIAQHPAQQRDASRLLVLHRATGALEHHVFRDLSEYLRPGDCLVLNDTRVIPARFFCRRETGGRIEVLYLHATDAGWHVLLRPSARLKLGERLLCDGADVRLVLCERGARGEWLVRPVPETPPLDLLQRVGRTPLPPYITRPDELPADLRTADVERYQTVYAQRPGAVAAPTAGLHFTPTLLDELAAAGVARATLTLHVGAGTFTPIATDNLADHPMHAEWYEVSAAAAAILQQTKAAGGRIVAVGTTATRVLESLDLAALQASEDIAARGWTDIFIYPPYQPRNVDALITNFHLPGSTLLALVMALASREQILAAYQAAVAERYRFYSYGDAMLIL